MTSNTYVTVFQEIFPPSTEILYDPNENLISGNTGGENSECFLIRIHGLTQMELVRLRYPNQFNCAMRGKDILANIQNAARILGVKQIIVSDYTEYEVPDREPICLWRYHILIHGISWYNKYGYVSNNHEDEVRHNAAILNSPLSDYSRFAEYQLFYQYFSPDDATMTVNRAMILLDELWKKQTTVDDDLYTLMQFLTLEPPIKYNNRRLILHI